MRMALGAPRPNLEMKRELADTMRTLGLEDNGRRRWHCRSCASEPPKGSKGAIIKWLRKPCRAPTIHNPSSCAPRVAGPVRHGIAVHASPAMRWWEVGAGSRKQSMVACSVCGGLGTDHYRPCGKLVLKECQPPTRTGFAYLKAFEKGLAPGHTNLAR